MEIQKIVNELIVILNENNNNDDYFVNRYRSLTEDLESMVIDIENNVYPDNLNSLPMFHYIDRNVDNPQIYAKMAEINDWYINNYRKKDEATCERELVMNYLISECSMSEKRAKSTIKGMAVHRDIYKEFVYYVKNKHFSDCLIVVAGYNAKILHEKYPLSVVGAYNYLIYLREEPDNALADLKAGLPKK